MVKCYVLYDRNSSEGMFAHPILKGVALTLKQAEQFRSEDSQERYYVETDILGSSGGKIYYE